MKKTKRFKATVRCLPLCAALAVGTPLWAQSGSSPEAPANTSVNAATSTPGPTRVGDATHNLWQRQREGREASATPRPIDGSVADLSQQRYQKSFEQPLPAWFDSRLKSK